MKLNRLEEAIYAAAFVRFFRDMHERGSGDLPFGEHDTWETGCAIQAAGNAQEVVRLHRKIHARPKRAGRGR